MKEIVIKIDDEFYEKLIDRTKYMHPHSLYNTLADAVRNGTELPKGHDRLIEAKKAKTYLYRNMEWYDENGYIADDGEKDKALQNLVDGIPTFIEADRGEE